MHRFLASVLLIALGPALAWCGKVKVWNHHEPAHYEKAELKGVVVSSDGVLRLGRQVKPIVGVEADHVWAVVEDSSGNLFAATANEGKVFKISSTGQASVVYQGDDSQVLSLVLGGDGTVYAGTGPSGHIIRIPADGEPGVFCRTGESYVWSLAYDPKHESLFAGTGPHGKVLKIDREGKHSVFCATKQDHVLCTALAADGNLYAGTAKRGLVYRIDAQGKGFVLFDAPQSEVRSLLVTADAVYAGTGSPGGRREPATTAAVPSTPGGVSQAIFVNHTVAAADKSAGKEKAQSGGVSSGSGAPTATGSSPTSSSAGSSRGDNSVYRIHGDGTVREVFREKAMMLSLLEQSGRLLVATGADGQVFELKQPQRERTELLRLDHTQIHCLCPRRDGGIVLGTGDPGKLYVLEDRLVNEGTVISEVLDAKTQSRWGAIHWKADTPHSTSISVAIRSGNVAEPDDTWSDWNEVRHGRLATEGEAGSPPSRFLQYRVTLRRHNPVLAWATATPVLRSLAIRYQPVNVAPEVTSIEVPDLDVATIENPKKFKIRWNATDANEDDLTYRLEYRKEGWKDWVVLETEWDKREYEWDSTTTPGGVYQFKVTASDRKDNPDEETLIHEKVSVPFVVDHSAPDLQVAVKEVRDNRAIVEAVATDGLTRLVSASFSIDSKKWTSVFPKDGLFDAKAKTFRFETDELKAGTHVVVVRVTDAAGNTGSQDVVFTVPAK